jgi:predicted transcriptional regulator
MAHKKSNPGRKMYGLRLDQALLRDLQHLAVDEDKWMNEMVEEAIRDLLKKYREKRKELR